MPKESEIKLRTKDLQTARLKCLELGAIESQTRSLEDNLIFDQPGRPLLNQGKLLRVRQYAGQILVTFKGQVRIENFIKHREEIEFYIDSMDAFAAFLENLGYSPQFRYQKYRQVFQVDESQLNPSLLLTNRMVKRTLKIMMDETPIGCFMELEGDEDLIHQAAHFFGYSREEYITQSYSDLFAEECREKGQPCRHMVFDHLL